MMSIYRVKVWIRNARTNKQFVEEVNAETGKDARDMVKAWTDYRWIGTNKILGCKMIV